ncbi:uncharacterized protein LOC110435931 [Sorghum bicolor]|uniref:uncharacterized protein LOC110435931 n=1 Tax=Sorghum bicolor TaxID=4558 RepID=UPI000B424E41|nr:uncharacterized protein LOC110435931 [Sorghum bicolor]|eukprot:XP_021317715.1 uncharacterized protein LOC110435931 [Sorghum bicolor]
MATEKTLREFSVPTVTNVATGPAVDTAGKNFELRTGLITMVQASPFCGLPSEDGNAHLQHFLELCDTIVIKDITPDVIRLRLFPLSLVGKAKSIGAAGEYILSCPHHGMENWMVLQNFYNGLTPMSKGHLDAAAGGAFLSLISAGAKALIEKMQLTERNQENPSNSVKAIDSHMTCEVCGEVGHSGNDCPETHEDAAYINNEFRQ